MEPENNNESPLVGGVDLGGGDGAAAIGPPGSAAPLPPPDGGVEFGGTHSNADDYDPAKDPELNADLRDDESDDDESDEADFDFSDDAKPETEAAPPADGGEADEELRTFVESMDAYLQQGGASLAQASAVPEATPQEFTPVQLTREQLEEALDDPDKLNDVLAEVQRQAVANAREAFHAEAQAHVLRSQTEVAQREADKMFAEHRQLDTPELRAKCALVAQTLVATKPELQSDIPTLMKYTAQYMTARMRTHPHEFVAGHPPGLPPLPGLRPAASQTAAPPKPDSPVFAGGGTSARRVRTQAKEMSEAERELHELKPEHAW